MSQWYQVLKADPLGDPYTPNFTGAKPTQTWWCQLEGVDKDVSIGKQVGNTLTPGTQVYGDLIYNKSQKGTEYFKFKSQKPPEGEPRPASNPAQAQAQQATGVNVSEQMPGWFHPVYNMIEYIYKEMKKMDTDAEPETTPEEAKGVEQLGGAPLDEETKKTLDDIFTPPETPEDVTEEPATEEK